MQSATRVPESAGRAGETDATSAWGGQLDTENDGLLEEGVGH